MKKTKKSQPKKLKDKPAKFNAMEHWKGMPEFNQQDATPIKQVIVGFATKEDWLKFEKIVGQQITAKTRSIWYPAVENNGASDKRYSDKK